MNIEPIEIFNNATKCIGKLGEKEILGYWINFRWASGEGYAFLFPGSIENIATGKLISVETDQEQIRNFSIVSESDNYEAEFRSLDSQGDYHIVGEVDVIHRNYDSNDFEVAYISVEDWSFTITCDDINLEEIQVGDIVEFDLLGLELFDECI